MQRDGEKKIFKLPALRGFWAALLHLALFILNLWLFLRIGLQTMIPTIGLVELYVMLGLLFSIFTREEVLKHKVRTGFLLVPFIINALLCINYWFSFNPVTETYAFRCNEEWRQVHKPVNPLTGSPSLITLQNNAYDAYPGIRVFWNETQMANSNKITYTFKTGLFGIRVMTHYKFI